VHLVYQLAKSTDDAIRGCLQCTACGLAGFSSAIAHLELGNVLGWMTPPARAPRVSRLLAKKKASRSAILRVELFLGVFFIGAITLTFGHCYGKLGRGELFGQCPVAVLNARAAV